MTGQLIHWSSARRWAPFGARSSTDPPRRVRWGEKSRKEADARGPEPSQCARSARGLENGSSTAPRPLQEIPLPRQTLRQLRTQPASAFNWPCRARARVTRARAALRRRMHQERAAATNRAKLRPHLRVSRGSLACMAAPRLRSMSRFGHIARRLTFGARVVATRGILAWTWAKDGHIGRSRFGCIIGVNHSKRRPSTSGEIHKQSLCVISGVGMSRHAQAHTLAPYDYRTAKAPPLNERRRS